MTDLSMAPVAKLDGPDVIKIVGRHSRLINYLFLVALLWVVFALIGMLAAAFFGKTDRQVDNLFKLFDTVVIMASVVFSVALAVDRAICRCPVCDAYVGRPTMKRRNCPSCKTSLR